MDLPRKTDLSDGLIKVEVYSHLVTSNSPEFDMVYQNMPNIPKNVDNMVLPIFKINMDMHGKRILSNEVIDKIIDETHEMIVQSPSVHKFVRNIKPENITNIEPIGIDKSKQVLVAEYYVSPENESLIGIKNIENIKNII